MSRKNRDHLAIQPDLECEWGFIAPSDASTCAEQAAEMQSICAGLFDAFEGFILPTGLSFKLFFFSDDRPLSTATADESSATIEKELSSNSGVGYEEFETAVQEAGSGPRWLPKVKFERNKVRIQLATEDLFIDRTDNCRTYKLTGEELDRDPYYDPIDLNVLHAKNFDHDEIDAEYLYYVTVKLHSYIWLEDSDVGKQNRDRLSAFFERIDETLPVATIDRHSNRRTNSQLAAIY